MRKPAKPVLHVEKQTSYKKACETRWYQPDLQLWLKKKRKWTTCVTEQLWLTWIWGLKLCHQIFLRPSVHTYYCLDSSFSSADFVIRYPFNTWSLEYFFQTINCQSFSNSFGRLLQLLTSRYCPLGSSMLELEKAWCDFSGMEWSDHSV